MASPSTPGGGDWRTARFRSLATARIASRTSWVLVLSVPVEVSGVSGGVESSTGWESTRTLALCSQPMVNPIRAKRERIKVVRMRSPFTTARIPADGHLAERTFLFGADRFRAIFVPLALWQNPAIKNKGADEREEE